MGRVGMNWETRDSKTTITCKNKEAYYITLGYLKDNRIDYIIGNLVCNDNIVKEFVFYEGLDATHNNNLNEMFKKLGI